MSSNTQIISSKGLPRRSLSFFPSWRRWCSSTSMLRCRSSSEPLPCLLPRRCTTSQQPKSLTSSPPWGAKRHSQICHLAKRTLFLGNFLLRSHPHLGARALLHLPLDWEKSQGLLWRRSTFQRWSLHLGTSAHLTARPFHRAHQLLDQKSDRDLPWTRGTTELFTIRPSNVMTRYTPTLSIRRLQAYLQLLLGNYLALRSIDTTSSKRNLFQLYNVHALHGFRSLCIRSLSRCCHTCGVSPCVLAFHVPSPRSFLVLFPFNFPLPPLVDARTKHCPVVFDAREPVGVW